MKTILEWLNELPEPYRSQGLENMDPERSNAVRASITEAVAHAFYWDRSPQGVEYWRSFYEELVFSKTPPTENMDGHPHAKIAQEYWREAEVDVKAWKNWMYEDSSGVWRNCIKCPVFHPDVKYRRKQRTININGHEVPEPLRECRDGQVVWTTPIFIADMENPTSSKTVFNNENKHHQLWLQRGMLQATKEGATAHAKALLSFTAKGGEA